MRHWPRKISVWDNGSTAPAATRSGREPINPLRIKRLHERGLNYREIGEQIAKEDGRRVPYVYSAVYRALREYKVGIRDEDGERDDFIPATNRKARPITLGGGIGYVMFRATK